MPDPAQKVSPKGIRILLVFVIIYLAVGFHMWLNMDLPSLAYVAYGIFAWVVGMLLFYRLHRSYMASMGEDIKFD